MSRRDDFFGNHNGLNRIYNNYGLGVLDRGVNVPDSALAIGSGEVMAPVGVMFSHTPILKQPPPSPIKDVQDTMIKTVPAGSLIETFPMEAYYGQPTGGY